MADKKISEFTEAVSLADADFFAVVVEGTPNENYKIQRQNTGLAKASDLSTHIGDTSNPHSVTAAQAGADPAGSAAAVQSSLDTHSGDATIHYTQASISIAPSQAGADPAGTAAGAVASHEGTYVHADIATAVQPGDDAADLGSGAAADGHVLTADGAGGAAWEAVAGGGTVTSVAVSGTDGIDVDSGSPITGAGTITLGVNAGTLATHMGLGTAAYAATTAFDAAGAAASAVSTHESTYNHADIATALQPLDNAAVLGSAAATDGYVLTANGAGGTAWEAVPGWDGDIAGINLDGGTDIGADLADADLLLVDDGAGGTNRKSALSRVWTYIRSKLFPGESTVTGTSGALSIDWSTSRYWKQGEPTGAITYTFSNPPAAQSHVQLRVLSDGTSTAQTFTWPAAVKWVGATWAAVANKNAVIVLFYDGTNYWAQGANEV